jgi:hypothetical protein
MRHQEWQVDVEKTGCKVASVPSCFRKALDSLSMVTHRSQLLFFGLRPSDNTPCAACTRRPESVAIEEACRCPVCAPAWPDCPSAQNSFRGESSPQKSQRRGGQSVGSVSLLYVFLQEKKGANVVCDEVSIVEEVYHTSYRTARALRASKALRATRTRSIRTRHKHERATEATPKSQTYDSHKSSNTERLCLRRAPLRRRSVSNRVTITHSVRPSAINGFSPA